MCACVCVRACVCVCVCVRVCVCVVGKGVSMYVMSEDHLKRMTMEAWND